MKRVEVQGRKILIVFHIVSRLSAFLQSDTIAVGAAT